VTVVGARSPRATMWRKSAWNGRLL
jgi:hypothetical protein